MSNEPGLDERLDAALRDLPRDVAPRRDLWPRIAAEAHGAATGTPASRGRTRGSGWSSLQLLAAACLLVAVTALVTYQLTVPSARTTVPAVALRTGAADTSFASVTTPPATPASFGRANGLGPDYAAARSALARTFEERLADLAPATREKVEQNLADIRRASAELSTALDEHPGSPLLQQLLLSTYEDELALFAQVNQVTATMSPRKDL
jgi:hypothetical protein